MSIFSKNDLPAAEERQIRPDAGIVAAELIRCRWLLLIGLLISAMLSYVFVTETYKEEYSSTATFFVTSKGSVTSTVFTNIENAKSLTEAFQYLLESDAMRRTVLDAIGETEFSGTITTSQLPETNIMSLTVTSDSPGLTFKIIRAVINNHHLITDNVMSNAAMDVLMQPTVPKAPTRALNRRSGVIKYTAILFAVIVSATVVYIIFSDKVRSERDLSALLPSCERLSTFGCEKHRRTLRSRLRRSRSAKKAASESLLVSNPTTSFGYAETFRLLRTRVEYLLNKNGQKTLLIASVAEGEGKTITAANLAVMLSYAGNKVLLIDGNCDTNGNPGLSKLFEPLADVFSTMKAYTGSVYVNDFNMFNRIYKVYIQAEAPYREHKDNINLFFVKASNGAMVPLTSLGNASYTTGPGSIKRFNMFTTAVIRGAAAQGYSSGQAMEIMEQIARDHLPDNIGLEWSGLSYQEKQAGGQTGMVMALVFLFVFLFLAAQYESWTVPIAVLLSLPVAALGAYLGVWVCGLENDVYFQIGLVMLVGLAAKNAILIVEFAKVQVDKGEDLVQSAIYAAKLRFRPILMTSLAFVLGMLPMVLASGPGSASRQAIGTGVFFGMIFAIVFGIILVPFFFVMVYKTKSKILKHKK